MSKYFTPIPVSQEEKEDYEAYLESKRQYKLAIEPVNLTLEEFTFNKLIDRLYWFDHTYHFADRPSSAKAREEEALLREIDELDDEETKAFLKNNFNYVNYQKIADRYPWMKYCGIKKSDVLKLIEQGLSQDDIANIRGLAKTLSEKFPIPKNGYSIYRDRLIYISKPSALVRDKTAINEKLSLDGFITGPKNIMDAFKEFAKAIQSKDVSIDTIEHLASFGNLVSYHGVQIYQIKPNCYGLCLGCYNGVVYL